MITSELLESINLQDSKVAFFRFKQFDKDNYLITNDLGDYHFLSNDDFLKFIGNEINENDPIGRELIKKGFIENPETNNLLAERYRKANLHLFHGPFLHIIELTGRCNENCTYCHAAARHKKKANIDMTIETARKVVDLIFSAHAKNITIEFQGGEPLLNWDTVKFILEYTTEKNATHNKHLTFTMVTNLSLMNQEKLSILRKYNVALCTSIDGPAKIHDKHRLFAGKSSFKITRDWLLKIQKDQKRGQEKGEHYYLIAGIMTTTKDSLPFYKEIIDEYVKLNLDKIFLRPLNPFGFAKRIWNKIGYDMEDFIDFYKKAFAYIIDLNKKGILFQELMATVYLKKILSDRCTNYVDSRSPCGASLGQVLYAYDGNIYTCDEGRMVARMQDDIFRIGNLDNTWKELIDNSVTKSVCVVSCTESLPTLVNNVYSPYIGVCPVYNYSKYGDIFCKGPANEWIKLHTAILDTVFKYLKNPETEKILKSWNIYTV